jgi:hypothetical protein
MKYAIAVLQGEIRWSQIVIRDKRKELNNYLRSYNHSPKTIKEFTEAFLKRKTLEQQKIKEYRTAIKILSSPNNFSTRAGL